MNKLIVATALSFLIPALALAQDASPQYRGQGHFVVGLGIGSRGPSAPSQVGFGGEGFLYKGLGLGLEGGYRSGGTGWLFASIDWSYHFGRHAKRGRVDPFVVVGGGGFFPAEHGNRGFPAFNFGGGINIWLSEHAALRLEIRDHVKHSSGIYGASLGPHYVSYRFGLTFR